MVIKGKYAVRKVYSLILNGTIVLCNVSSHNNYVKVKRDYELEYEEYINFNIF